MKLQFFIIYLLVIHSFSLLAQSDTAKLEEKPMRHRLTGVIGHAIQPTAIDEEGNKKWVALASWGLDYDYKLSGKWSIGLHSDIILQNFNVEEETVVGGNENKVLQRRTPLALCAVGIYKPTKHLSTLAGIGEEFSLGKGESLFLVRLGLEYGYEILEKYELGLSLNYDVKVEAYSTFVLGLGVSRLF